MANSVNFQAMKTTSLTEGEYLQATKEFRAMAEALAMEMKKARSLYRLPIDSCCSMKGPLRCELYRLGGINDLWVKCDPNDNSIKYQINFDCVR